MNEYQAFYGGKQTTLQADSLYAAKQAAIAHFKPRRSQEHMVHVYLTQLHQADNSYREVRQTTCI